MLARLKKKKKKKRDLEFSIACTNAVVVAFMFLFRIYLHDRPLKPASLSSRSSGWGAEREKRRPPRVTRGTK